MLSKFDLSVIGFGIRGLGLVTANLELRKLGLIVFYDEAELGSGAFSRLYCQSNSLGTDFFNWIDQKGPYAPILSLPAVARLRSQTNCFDLQELAAALREAGEFVRDTKPGRWEFVPHRVVEIVSRAKDDKLTIRTSREESRTIDSSIAVLASGVEERVDKSIASISRKLITSSTLLAKPHGETTVAEILGNHAVTILGFSHSAFSSLWKLLSLGMPAECITMCWRTGAKLHYTDLSAYNAEPHSPFEVIPTDGDICTLTGQVFRYHGLRHRSKQLFLDVAHDRLRVNLVLNEDQATTVGCIKNADLVIQATGYSSKLPSIQVNGQDISMTSVARSDAIGRLAISPEAVADNVFLMGCDPYPYIGQTDPSNQYVERGASIISHLREYYGV